MEKNSAKIEKAKIAEVIKIAEKRNYICYSGGRWGVHAYVNNKGEDACTEDFCDSKNDAFGERAKVRILDALYLIGGEALWHNHAQVLQDFETLQDARKNWKKYVREAVA